MTIEHVMQRVGRIIAADQGLTVEVRGVQAYAVKGKVVLPAVETYEWLGRNAERMLHGLSDHECGHAGDTRFELIEGVAKRGPSFKFLWNAMEDGYVESRKGRQYVGCSQNLSAKNEWFWNLSGGKYKSLRERISSPPDLWSAFCLALTMVVRPYGGQRIEAVKPLNEKVYSMLDQCRKEIAALAALSSKPRATAEVIALCECIYKRFEQQAEKAKAKASSPESGEDEETEDEKGTDSEGDEGEGEDSDDGSDSDPGADGSDADRHPGGDAEPPDEDAESPDEDGDADGEGGGGDSDGGDDGSPTPGVGSGEDEEEGEGGLEGDSEAEGEGEGGSGGSGSDEGESGSEDEGKSEEGEESKPLSGDFDMDLSRWSEPVGFSMSPEEEINRRIRSVFEQPKDVQPYTVFSTEYDIERDFSKDDLRGATSAFDRDSAAVHMAADALTLAFESALRSKREVRAIGGHDEGTIDETLLAEYGVGVCPSDRLYQQFVAEDSDDVAVAVLIDCSGSMGNGKESKSLLARRAAIAIHLALSQCQIAHEITGFTTVDSDGVAGHPWLARVEKEAANNFACLRRGLVEAEAHGTNVDLFAREIRRARGVPGKVAGTAVLLLPTYAVFKSFDCEDGRGLVNVCGLQENLDGEAVIWQARRLAQRPEVRRVMFVLSDGYPAGSRDNAQGARYLSEAIERVTEAGIEIHGIGIQSTAVEDYYPRSWVCNDLTQLTSIALSGMIEVLTESRTERAWIHLDG
jgi:cobaltochelatase CobT